MKIHPKSPQVIEAQVAAYAAEHNAHSPDRSQVIGAAGLLAANRTIPEGGSINRELPEREAGTVGNGYVVTEGPQTIADRQAYVAFLREKGGARNELIAYRAELLSNWDRFRGPVTQQSEKLGHGGSSEVSRIIVDGTPYAIRRMRNAGSEDQLDTHLLAAAKVQQMPDEYRRKVEHVVAATYEDGGMTVASLMPGKSLNELTKEELSSVSVEQVRDFVDTIVAAGEVGVGFDISKRANFFYDSNEGFGVVDLHAATADTPHVVSARTTLTTFPRMISYVGSERQTLSTPKDYADAASQATASLPFLETYAQACASLPDTVLDAEAKQQIAASLEETHQDAVQFADPDWVAAEIDKHQRARANYDPDDLV